MFTDNYIDYIILVIILFAGMLLSYQRKKLTLIASISGGILAFFIFLGSSFTGLGMLSAFFILATLATFWKKKLKTQLGLEENNKGIRNTRQVLANGGLASLLGFLSVLFPQHSEIVIVMLASALSSATADTLSSELGNIYGSKFYHILTFTYDERGKNGVISLEGTLFGLFGSFVIALIYSIGFDWSVNSVIIIVSGFVGNSIDSILGATLERKGILGNDAVNTLNTVAAAITAFVLKNIF